MALPDYASPLERLWHYAYIAICVAVFIFLISPILIVIPLSFNAEPYFTFTPKMLALDPEGYSLRWYDMLLTLGLIDKLLKLSDQVQILGPQAFRPYPGSELYNECLASGWQAPQSLEEWARLAEGELNFLSVKNFPWIKKSDRDFVESMEAYGRPYRR
jgi:hypothetical protein